MEHIQENTHVYLIGNAHLDPVWMWHWQEGYTEVKATFRSALDRMKEFPDYVFTSACAAYYEWIQTSDPAMFDEIRARVAEGRWAIVGGWYIQPDCNMPCGESFARHALLSQRYFLAQFGRMAKTGYNVDSFGHNGSIPKMLRQSRMENYVFMRPMAHEKALPADLFIWESADGSRIPTYRIHPQYNISADNFTPFDHCMNAFNVLADEAATLHQPTMAFYGIGNHGGGATAMMLRHMQEKLDGRFVYASPDTFFAAVEEYDLPVVRDDLQFHAKGCYSVCARIKALNRKSEQMLLAAEAYASLSHFVMQTPYPQAELNRAWKNLLFNQFHDVLGGCSIKSAYDDAAMTHGEAQAIASRTANFACQQISWHINTSVGLEQLFQWSFAWRSDNHGAPIVVFNPHPWRVKTLVRTSLNPVSEVYDVNGNELPLQSVRASFTNGASTHESAFLADVPALGYTIFSTNTHTPLKPYASPFTVGDVSVENGLIRIVFDKETGELASFYDKKRGVELLSGVTDAVLMDETNADTWAHDIKSFKKRAETAVGGHVHLLEAGPVLVTFRSERTVETAEGITKIRRDYSLLADSDTVTVKTVIDFHAHHRMLKFTFPTAVQNPRVLCEIPFGTMQRPTDGTEQVCGRWFAACGTDENGRPAANGLAVLNDGKYSFDAEGSVLSLTVLRGAIFLDHFAGTHRDEFCEFQDQGIHEFTYALTPFGCIADTVKKAAELNQSPFCVTETFHEGDAPADFSGISVSENNIIVTAVKQHEDSDAVVLRAYECEDRDTDCNFTLFGTTFTAHFGHSQVKTFTVARNGCVTESDFIE